MKSFFLACICLLFFACSKQSSTNNSKLPFIPENASIIIKCTNLKQLQSHLANNLLTQKNNTHPLFNYFKNITPLDLISAKKYDFYLCLSPLGKTDFGYTVVTSMNNILLNAELIKSSTTGSFTYNNKAYNEITIKDNLFYSTELNDTWVISDNKIILENSIQQYQNKKEIGESLQASLKSLSNNRSFSVVINNKNIRDIAARLFPNANKNTLKTEKWSGWTAGDFDIKANSVEFNGVYKPKDSIHDYMNIFYNLEAQQNQLVKITPAKAKSFTSYTYDNYEQLAENLALYNDNEFSFSSDILNDFLSNTNEFGTIKLENGNVLAFSLLNEQLDIPTYIQTNGVVETFRDYPIYKLEKTIDFSKQLSPILPEKNVEFYVLIDNFIAFSESSTSLKDMISALKNNDIFTEKSWYDEFSEHIANQSNILSVSTSENLLSKIVEQVSSEYSSSWNKANLADYNMAAIQITAEENFAHIHQIASKITVKKSDLEVSQTASVVLQNPIATIPKFVKNHVTKGMDIVVQDAANELSLISPSGKILWQKELSEAVIGEIQQVDMYKNGRLQLIFTTPSRLYILDRNGNNVPPFPVKFNNTITQPVAVFDYNNNRNYRIAVVQNQKMNLYDIQGKLVKGFRFKNKADGTIINAPKHIRVGSKDFIVVNENIAGVHFLNRKGNERIKLKSSVMTKNEWYWYKNAFSTLSTDNLLTQITVKGKVSKIPLSDSNENTQITATAKTLVAFTENTLTIKGKKIDLDFGLYAAPKIFYINNKIYISITDTQTSKVYSFDSNANPINGFPLYGNSLIDIANADKDNALELITKGEDNSILIYEMN